VTGLVTALILYFTSSFIIQLLQLSPEKSPQPHPLTQRWQRKRFKGFDRFQRRTTLHNWKPDGPNYLTTESDRDSDSPGEGPSSYMKDEDTYYATWKDKNRGESEEGDLRATMILEEEDGDSEHSGL
jgi:hypothetical protein